jgi:hypothetical protein
MIRRRRKTMGKEENLEISKMLTLSTRHVTEDAMMKLAEMTMEGEPYVVYEKEEYGFFILVGKKDPEGLKDTLPSSLKDVIAFAYERGIDWLCLDRDGAETEALPAYVW